VNRLGLAIMLFLVPLVGGCNKSDDNGSPTAPSSSTPSRIIGLSGNLAFGSVNVGSARDATLTITNSGNQSLNVSGMTVTGGLSDHTRASWTSGNKQQEAGVSGGGGRGEEAAARSVGAFAAPEFSIGRGLRLVERHRFILLRSDAGERAVDDHVAFAGHHDAFLRDDEAIALAAAPFAGGVAMSAARDPTVVSGSIGNDEHECSKGQRKPCKASEHGLSLSLSRRGDRLIQQKRSLVPG